MAVVDDQRAATAGKNPAIAYRVASICAMLDEHDATETPMSASRVAAVYSMIADVANAAAEGRMTGRRRWKPYTGIARRYDYLSSAVLEMARPPTSPRRATTRPATPSP
ncbi:hypothetical protein ZWY2020_010533 [Hordeum vulgare]|nr:hypothetical protein ZWY2020_010533 [Hordeum vulgare]